MLTKVRLQGFNGFAYVFYDGYNSFVCRYDGSPILTTTDIGKSYDIEHEQPLVTGDINNLTGIYLPE